MEPFDTINFKKTRKQVSEAIDFHLRPWLQLKLLRWRSELSWRRRHAEHRQRLFNEQQRSGLYHAMLKHHVYPNFRQFTHDFRGKVKYIDFFEFMVNNCKNKLDSISEPEMPDVNSAYLANMSRRFSADKNDNILDESLDI